MQVSGAYLYVKSGEVAEVMKVKGGELYSLGSEAVAGLDAQLPGLREKVGVLLLGPTRLLIIIPKNVTHKRIAKIPQHDWIP